MIGAVIVGLGNPGRQYANSRHNVGFRCVDVLARAHGLTFSQRYAHSLVAHGSILGVEVVLAKPRTFMNLSGDAVLGLLARHRVKPSSLVVVYDDMDLPLGKIRLRPGGSAGGHKGMLSIIDRLGTQEFPRLRIGIGRPTARAGLASPEEGHAVQHVLGSFRPEELPELEEVLQRAVAALECVLRGGLVVAMSLFNG
ncbi:MAG: aminoacyl-tRNA hydrolase [Actinobacteria bacterium]|nr:aminoacyl-tRNA hydrolase [Actinomycetota bacterium]MCL5026473.1 aminoacyl-tRNA hydrolase [Chloroflexota bacterium]